MYIIILAIVSLSLCHCNCVRLHGCTILHCKNDIVVLTKTVVAYIAGPSTTNFITRAVLGCAVGHTIRQCCCRGVRIGVQMCNSCNKSLC